MSTSVKIDNNVLELIKAKYKYDALTGRITCEGKDISSYLITSKHGKTYLYHRFYFNETKDFSGWKSCTFPIKKLAWFLHTGEYNERIVSIKTINKNESDLRIINLTKQSKADTGAGKHKTSIPKTSVYKGVYWSAQRGLWHASIAKDGTSKFIGGFSNEEDAANAYNVEAIKMFGDKARLNPCKKCKRI